MVIGKRHPSETPIALWVPSVSPGIENEKGGVGFTKRPANKIRIGIILFGGQPQTPGV